MAKGFQLFPYYRSFLENNPFTSSLQTFAPGVQSIVTLGLSYLHVLVLQVQMHYTVMKIIPSISKESTKKFDLS